MTRVSVRSTVRINVDQINVDSVNGVRDDDVVSTYIRAAEAARILGVTPETLYAYVSRGRIARRTAADGRASLFALEEVEALARRSRRSPAEPRPTIDVQIASRVTALSEDGVRYRGHALADLVRHQHFEDVAELIWSPGPSAEDLDDAPPAAARERAHTTWPAADADDLERCRPIRDLAGLSVPQRMATACSVLGAAHPADGAADAARRLLLVTPPLLGSSRRTGPFAERVATLWRRRPSPELARAVDVALMCLADHELATSTLAVRIAASVRTSPYGGIAAGLAVIEGALHGSAAALAHGFIDECAADGAAAVVRRYRQERRPIPGFGHKVYRSIDPRCALLMEAVRPIDASGDRVWVVDDMIAEVGRVLPHPPNIDVALGALTWIAGLDPDVPLFAIARVAGWAAHFAEELDERPVRYRGLARAP
jgi:citrate synthase